MHMGNGASLKETAETAAVAAPESAARTEARMGGWLARLRIRAASVGDAIEEMEPMSSSAQTVSFLDAPKSCSEDESRAAATGSVEHARNFWVEAEVPFRVPPHPPNRPAPFPTFGFAQPPRS